MTKKKGFKRALSLICVLCLTLAVLGSNVFAAADDLDDENAITAQAETIDDSEAIQETQSDDAAAAEDAADPLQEEAEPADGNAGEEQAPVEETGSETQTADEEEEAAEPPVEETRILRAPVLRAVQNDVITKIEAQTYNGSGPQGSTGQWDVFRLYAEFALPNGQVHAGDTTVITLPEKLKFNQTSSFEIKDASGNVVANAVINGGAKTVTLTYTDYVDNNSDVTGNFYFYVQVDRNNVDGEEYIPLEIDVSGKTVIGNPIHFIGIPDPVPHYLTKSGWQATSAGDRAIRYQLAVNTKGEAMENVTITDKIATAGFTILPDSFLIVKGTWVAVHGEWQLQNQTNVTADYPVTWNDDGSFTIDFGNISATDGFTIRYTAEASYDLVDGEIIQNDAVIRGSNIVPHTASATATYYVAGGSAEGYVFTINIHKVSEDGSSLAGAVFNVVRVANDTVVGTITTDTAGNGSVSGLLKDAYQLVEISAPPGYVLTGPVDVSPEDFGSDKTVLKTITNETEKTEIDVTKVWSDADDQDGIRPQRITVRLLADGVDTGKTVVLSPDNNWTDSFPDLDEFQNGQKVTYTVEEVTVTGYTTVVTGDAETGYTVTNTHEPEVTVINGTKTWDDNDNQDGARPESITIRLLANGSEIQTVTVTEEDDWSWHFEDLPKYENGGSEITYSITEDAVADYTAVYSGYDVTNTHTPGKTSLTVTKAWDDGDNRDGLRPDSVTVKLMADGADTGKTVVLNPGNNWTDSFTELDAYQNGQQIAYTVEEVTVSGYTAVVTGDAGTGFTVTNTHESERTNISVTKLWDDQNNKAGSRPQTITIRLLADGKDTGKTLTLSADNKWQGSFTDLEQYQDGKKIVYTIFEDPVNGYTTTITGDAETGFTVTNKMPTPPAPSTDRPKTGDSTRLSIYLWMLFVSGIAIGSLWLTSGKRKDR